MQKIFKQLFKQFVAKNGVEPKGIELLQMKFKANELKRQADKVKVVDFEKTPTKVRPGQEATVNTLRPKSDDVAPGTLQADVENLKVDAEDMMNDAIKNKNQAVTDLDDFIETGGQPFKKKDDKFLGGSMHEEGQIRTGVRMFLQDELKNGRLKLNKEDTARVMEYFPTKEDDPILVFKKIYGDDAYNAAGKFPGAFERGEDYNSYREIFKENMGDSFLKVKTKENLGDGTLTLTDEVRAPIKDEDVPFAGGGVVKKIIKSITMRNKDPMDSMKELNEVLKRKKELDLTDNQVDEIMEAGNEWIFQRDPDNLFVPTKDKPKTLFDDEVEEVSTDIFKKKNDKDFVSNYKDQVKTETEEGIGSLTDDLETKLTDESSTQVFKDDKGGIKGISIGGDDEFKKGVADILNDTSPEALAKSIEIDNLMLKYDGMGRELAEQIASDTNPQRKADVISMVEQTMEMGQKGMSGDEIIEIFKKTPRTKQADGGPVEFEKWLEGKREFEKQENSEELYKQYLEDMRRKKIYDNRTSVAGGGPITSTGLNSLLGEDDNNRVPYATGGRRGFLKLLAGLGAAGAAFKTGLMSLKGGAKPIAKEIVKEAATGQPPAYFLNLVAKIKTLGDDAPRLAVKDREKVTTYKDYTLTEDVTTGEQTIQRMKVTDPDSASYYGQPLTEETYMNFKPGKGQMDETTKGKIPPDEYEEGTAHIRSDRGNAGEIVDESAEISDEVIEEGTVFEDNLSDFGKADGGRINHAAGGIAKLIKKLNDIAPGSTKLGATSKKLSKKADDKKALQQAIRDFEKRTKTSNPLGLSEEFIRGLNKKVKKQMGE